VFIAKSLIREAGELCDIKSKGLRQLDFFSGRYNDGIYLPFYWILV